MRTKGPKTFLATACTHKKIQQHPRPVSFRKARKPWGRVFLLVFNIIQYDVGCLEVAWVYWKTRIEDRGSRIEDLGPRIGDRLRQKKIKN